MSWNRFALPALVAALIGWVLVPAVFATPVLASPDPFPVVEAERVGIPDAALARLAEHVQAMVADEEIVGGELLVIKDRRTVLRRAFGHMDREAEQPLVAGAVYCVRSMTKPVIGTAIQMLIDEGRLRLDSPVGEILPAFAGVATLTVEHLLTHSGGFPFTTMNQPLASYTDIGEVAAEAAAAELLFEPGSRFGYSDASSDILGAVVAAVTGVPPEVFVQERILTPLGMGDAFTLLGARPAAASRVPSAYSGGTGKWAKHWQSTDPPIFPLFLPSQGLYATTTDYARFLALWMDGGRVGDRRLLSAPAVERALTAVHTIEDHPLTGDGLRVAYGQHWIVYEQEQADRAEPRSFFGHDGSDGTYAWAWPEEDLMVLFFTQSRGTLAGLPLQRTLQTLLVDQDLDRDEQLARTPANGELAQVAGLYWDESVPHAYYVIAPRGDGLTLERPGKMRLVFVPGDSPDTFVHEAGAPMRLTFVRGEEGVVTAMQTQFGPEVELDPRHVPEPDLPSVDEVVEKVVRAHRVDRLSSLGPVRLRGRVKLVTRNLEGRVTRIFDAERQRTELDFGGVQEVVVTDVDRAWTRSTGAGREVLEGERLEQALLDHVAVAFGDWRMHYRQVEVLKRARRREGSPILIVRVVPHEGPGATMYVDEDSGRLLFTFGLVQIPGVGIVGVQNRFEDYRDVGGMILPFHTVSMFASKMIGRVEMTIDKAKVGVEVSKRAFSAP